MAASEYRQASFMTYCIPHDCPAASDLPIAPRLVRACPLRFPRRPPSRTFAPSSCHECARFGRCRPGRLVLMEALGVSYFFDPMQIACSHELTHSLTPQSSIVPSRPASRPGGLPRPPPAQMLAPIFSGACFRHFCFVYLPRMCPLWSSPDTLNFSVAPCLLSLCPAALAGGAGRN